jgi:hypothetical protein
MIPRSGFGRKLREFRAETLKVIVCEFDLQTELPLQLGAVVDLSAHHSHAHAAS